MTTDRIPCIACEAMILPTTSKATGGLCMPCKKGSSFLTRESMVKNRVQSVDESITFDDEDPDEHYEAFEVKVEEEFNREIQLMKREFINNWDLTALAEAFFSYPIAIDSLEYTEDYCIDFTNKLTLVKQYSVSYEGDFDQMWQVRIPLDITNFDLKEATWFESTSLAKLISFSRQNLILSEKVFVKLEGGRL